MFRFLVALFLSTAAFSQPQPFVVFQADSGISLSSPRVCLRDTSVADVFWVRISDSDSEQYLEHAVVSLTQRQLTSGPNVIQHTENWSQQIGDVISRGQNGWAAVLYEERLHPFGSIPNRLFFTSGGDADPASTLLDSATWWYMGCSGWSNSHTRLSERVGGGLILSWIHNGCQLIPGTPFSEPLNNIELGWVSSDLGLETRATCCADDYLYGPEDAHCISLDPDTVITLSLIDGENLLGTLAGLSWQPFDEHGPSHVQFSCSTAYVDLRKTRGNRLLALTSSTAYPVTIGQLREIHRDGTCSSLHDYTPALNFNSIAYHPDFGFAVLSVSSSFILLSRIDTNGVEVQPLGVFHERDSDHVIGEAGLTIGDGGRVVVLWTEHADGSSDNSIVKAAWVNWNTFLGADNHSFIPHPSSLSLSASPNPFNSDLRIEYSLLRAQNIELSVYNLLGQRVATLLNGRRDAGTQQVIWSPHCAGGLYFVSLKTASAVKTAKVLYLR